mgnify:CR=1 FL=1
MLAWRHRDVQERECWRHQNKSIPKVPNPLNTVIDHGSNVFKEERARTTISRISPRQLIDREVGVYLGYKYIHGCRIQAQGIWTRRTHPPLIQPNSLGSRSIVRMYKRLCFDPFCSYNRVRRIYNRVCWNKDRVT